MKILFKDQMGLTSIALEKMAINAGADSQTALAAAGKLAKELDILFEHGPDINQSDVLLKMRAVFDTFEDEAVTEVMRQRDMGKVLAKTIRLHADQLLETQVKINEVYVSAVSVSERFNRVFSSPRAALSQEDMEPLLLDLDDVTDGVRKMLSQIEERVSELFQNVPPPTGVGPKNAKLMLADEPILGAFIDVADKESRGLDQAAEIALFKRGEKMAEAHLQNVKKVAADLETKAHEATRLLDVEFGKLRTFEDVEDGVIRAATDTINDMLTRALGEDIDILDPKTNLSKLNARLSNSWNNVDQSQVLRGFLGMSFADEYIRAGNLSEAGWHEAIENVLYSGPTDPSLYAFWESSLSAR
jgi:hypothetical protein